mmetsp:Transcript_57644/g.137080  ORF Transcript_57644/g.137080 Transcript_57644/m.137080 type:complete len:323 (-) Transcript_57644:15-983(-)
MAAAMSLLAALFGPEEEIEVKAWCRENGHDRPDFFEPRLDKADELRVEANGYFKRGEYDDALQRYLGAVWQLDYDPSQMMSLQPEHQEDLDRRKLKAIKNICLTCLRMAEESGKLESVDPDSLGECLGVWEDVTAFREGDGRGEGKIVEDPDAIAHEQALAEARKRDPDILDLSKLEGPKKTPVPRRRQQLTVKEKKVELYRKVKTTADIGLKHIVRGDLNDKESQAKLFYWTGIAESERGFSEPAYEAFKHAAEIMPSDRDYRKALADSKEQVKLDRAEAKETWKGKLKPEEEQSSSWLVPRTLMGWIRRKAFAPKEDDVE